MKRALIGLAVLPLFATGAAAAERLGDGQLDQIVAGDVGLPGINCPACTFATSSSNSNNGVTVSTSSTGVTNPPAPPPPDNGGGGGGGGGSGGGGSGGGGPTVVISLGGPTGIPAGAAAALQTLLGGAVTIH